jgi:chromosome partitioning protein
VVGKRLNNELRLTGVLLCMYDANTRLSTEVTSDIADFFTRGRTPDCLWTDARIFETRIRRNVRLAEAPSFGQSILQYAPTSNGAEDYRSLAAEVRAMTQIAAAA